MGRIFFFAVLFLLFVGNGGTANADEPTRGYPAAQQTTAGTLVVTVFADTQTDADRDARCNQALDAIHAPASALCIVLPATAAQASAPVQAVPPAPALPPAPAEDESGPQWLDE